MSAFTTQISKVIKEALHTYFINLNGENPASSFYQDMIFAVEKSIIEETLLKVELNQKKAAEILGMSRNTLSKKINLYKINLQKMKNNSYRK